MRVSKLFVTAALAASLSAHAQFTNVGVVTPGVVGPMDNSVAIPVGAHAGDTAGFLDAFVFSVTNPGLTVGAIDFSLLGPNSLPADHASIAGILFIDSSANVVAQDIDGTDGFLLGTPLAAGTYAFEVLGVGGAGQGLYSGVLLSINPAVPEPESYALMLGGLALVAGIARRQRKGQ